MTASSYLPRAAGSAAALLFALAPAVASAAAPAYREVTLLDGRVYVGEVVTTEPAGVRLRLPQGQVVVPFHQLQNMAPSTASAFEGQREWEVVVVGADEPRRWVEQAVRTLPATKVAGDTGLRFPLNPGQVAVARKCAPETISCAIQATQRDELWAWVVTVSVDDTGEALLRGATSSDSAGRTVRLDNLYDAGALLRGLDELFGLSQVPGRSQAATTLAASAPAGAIARATKSPKSKPSKDRTPRVARAPSEGAASAFVPVPGYTALRDGDMGGFGLALAVVVPTTAAWVGLTGSQSQSLGEHAALSVGGYYLTTVLVNQVLGSSGARAAVGVAPLPGARGAQVSIAVPLR